MKVQTERLESLSKTLLDLSRLDANALTFRLEEVDLEDLLYELRRDFAYTGREINIQAEEDVPSVRTDPTQLHRVLAILLDNALKYSGEPEGNGPVDLELHREDGRAVVSVVDRGCGIPVSRSRARSPITSVARSSSRASRTSVVPSLSSCLSLRFLLEKPTLNKQTSNFLSFC
jgi:signal transduction histidine kinase